MRAYTSATDTTCSVRQSLSTFNSYNQNPILLDSFTTSLHQCCCSFQKYERMHKLFLKTFKPESGILLTYYNAIPFSSWLGEEPHLQAGISVHHICGCAIPDTAGHPAIHQLFSHLHYNSEEEVAQTTPASKVSHTMQIYQTCQLSIFPSILQ